MSQVVEIGIAIYAPGEIYVSRTDWFAIAVEHQEDWGPHG